MVQKLINFPVVLAQINELISFQQSVYVKFIMFKMLIRRSYFRFWSMAGHLVSLQNLRFDECDAFLSEHIKLLINVSKAFWDQFHSGIFKNGIRLIQIRNIPPPPYLFLSKSHLQLATSGEAGRHEFLSMRLIGTLVRPHSLHAPTLDINSLTLRWG